MSLVIAIAAVIVSALTMIVVALQVAEARKANALPATIGLFREYRTAEMEKARRLLTERLPDLDPASGMRGLPDDVAIAAVQVGLYLDNVGVLVARGLLAPELAAGFLGRQRPADVARPVSVHRARARTADAAALSALLRAPRSDSAAGRPDPRPLQAAHLR